MVGRFGEVLVLDWGVAQDNGHRNGSSRRPVPQRAVARFAAPSLERRTIWRRAGVRRRRPSGRTQRHFLTGKNAGCAGGRRASAKTLQAISGKAAAPDRALRYAGPSSFSADIERFLGGEPVLAYRETVLERLVG